MNTLQNILGLIGTIFSVEPTWTFWHKKQKSKIKDGGEKLYTQHPSPNIFIGENFTSRYIVLVKIIVTQEGSKKAQYDIELLYGNELPSIFCR